jgi:hypothetical protein
LPLFKKLRIYTGLFIFVPYMIRYLRISSAFVLSLTYSAFAQSSQDSAFFIPSLVADSSVVPFLPVNNFSPFFLSQGSFLHASNPSIPVRVSSIFTIEPGDFYSIPFSENRFLNTLPGGLFSFRHPVTLTQALVSSQKEQNFYLFHSRNISAKWNFTSEMEFFRTPGIISNSGFNSSRFFLNSSGIWGGKNQWLSKVDFSHNKNFGPQSGGIKDSTDFLSGSGLASNSNALIDVRFSNAASKNIRTSILTETWLKFKGDFILDSLNPLVNFRSGSFILASAGASDSYNFFFQRSPSDDSAMKPSFDSVGYDDRIFLRKAFFNLGFVQRKFSGNLSRVLKSVVLFDHEFLSQNGIQRSFNLISLFLDADIRKDRYGFAGFSRVFVSGVRSGNYVFSFRPWITIKNVHPRLFLNFHISSMLPDYRYFFFNGNQYYWENNLRNTSGNIISAGLEWTNSVKIEIGRGANRSMPRLNLNIDSVEFSGQVNYLFSKIGFQKQIRSYFFSLDGCYQSISDNGFETGMPRTQARFSNHHTFYLLKEKLKLSPGFDVCWFEGLSPYTFHAPTGLFAFRNSLSQREGLIAGFFVGFRLPSFKATLRVDNVLDRFLSPDPTMMIDGFPVQSRVIRLNIIWLFWD